MLQKMKKNIHILNYLIDKLLEEKYINIQILTCKTEETSILKMSAQMDTIYIMVISIHSLHVESIKD